MNSYEFIRGRIEPGILFLYALITIDAGLVTPFRENQNKTG